MLKTQMKFMYLQWNMTEKAAKKFLFLCRDLKVLNFAGPSRSISAAAFFDIESQLAFVTQDVIKKVNIKNYQMQLAYMHSQGSSRLNIQSTKHSWSLNSSSHCYHRPSFSSSAAATGNRIVAFNAGGPRSKLDGARVGLIRHPHAIFCITKTWLDNSILIPKVVMTIMFYLAVTVFRIQNISRRSHFL